MVIFSRKPSIPPPYGHKYTVSFTNPVLESWNTQLNRTLHKIHAQGLSNNAINIYFVNNAELSGRYRAIDDGVNLIFQRNIVAFWLHQYQYTTSSNSIINGDILHTNWIWLPRSSFSNCQPQYGWMVLYNRLGYHKNSWLLLDLHSCLKTTKDTIDIMCHIIIILWYNNIIYDMYIIIALPLILFMFIFTV